MGAASIGGNLEALRLVQQFDESLRLARATELATSNRLLEAEALLCPRGGADVSVAELDLLARIHVRQGRFDAAKRRWKQAVVRAVDSRVKFEECLRVLEEYRIRRMRRRKMEWWITLTLLISSLAISIWVLFRLNFFIPT